MTLEVRLFLTLLSLSVMTFVLIAIHELGHLLGGTLIGFRWETMKVGPFQLGKDDKGHWRFSHSEGYMHGFIQMLPRENLGTRFQWAVFLLMGSIANLLLSAAIFLFLRTQSIAQQQASAWLGFAALMSGMVGVMNLMPFRYRRLRSDGLQFWHICLTRKGFQEFEAQWKQSQDKRERYRLAVARQEAITAFVRFLMEGKRPREWDAALIGPATLIRDDSQSEATGAYYGYLWAMDSEDWEAAGAFLERALRIEHLEKILHHLLVTEKAFWVAQHRRDAAEARRWLAQSEKEYEQNSSCWRAKAAICWAAGDEAGAAEAAQKARKALTPADFVARCLLDKFMSGCSNPARD